MTKKQKQTRQSARVAMRLLPQRSRDIIRRMAKIAGVHVHTALQWAIDQNATDGDTPFTVPTKDGTIVSYTFDKDCWLKAERARAQKGAAQ